MSKIEISQVGKFDNSRRFFNILPRQFFGFFDPRKSQLSVSLVINPNNHFWFQIHSFSVQNDHFLPFLNQKCPLKYFWSKMAETSR